MDTVDELLIEVRAGTQGFAQDIAAMRSTFDGTLVGGFQRAGQVLESGLLSAIRSGGLGFDDLKRMAFSALDQIAAQALQLGLDKIFGGGGSAGGAIGGLLGGLLGLPGRATGGPVSPGRPFLVGERGPEVFVPTSAGRVETGIGGRPRDVRVSINVATPRGASAPTAMERSNRQIAAAIRRSLLE